MNAVILAAGKGTRLGAITESVPKPLLEIKGVPILRHTVEQCVRHGINRIFINTHHLADRITAAIGDGAPYGATIRYSFEETLLGTAGALWNFRQWIDGDDFFVIYGDNYFDYDLGAIAAFHRAKGGIATVALYEIDDVSQSGIAVLDERSRILRFIEKPRPEEIVSHLVNCGIYMLSPRVFEFLPDGPSDFGRDVFPRLLQAGEAMYGMVHEAGLIPVDTEDMLAKARTAT